MTKKRMKIELHAHTSEVSECGVLNAQQLMDLCAKAGYDAVVITDHLYHGWSAHLSKEKRVERFLSGYRAAVEAGKKRSIKAWLGIEARIALGHEDYLIYGVREKHIEPLMTTIDRANSLDDLTTHVHDLGLIIVQAHPFRPYLRAMPYDALDGIEAYNANPRQQNHNDLALAHALKCGRLMTSGSDVHQKPDVGRGGIWAPEWVADNASLLEYFKGFPVLDRIEEG